MKIYIICGTVECRIGYGGGLRGPPGACDLLPSFRVDWVYSDICGFLTGYMFLRYVMCSILTPILTG